MGAITPGRLPRLYITYLCLLISHACRCTIARPTFSPTPKWYLDEVDEWLRVPGTPPSWDSFGPLARIQWTCPDEERIGTTMDGGKWICGITRVSNSGCLVYSLGSNGEDNFECSISHRAPRCKIHTADKDYFKITNRTTFHTAMIEGPPDHSKSIAIKDFMSKLGHKKVDIFKMDIEGNEEGALRNLFGPNGSRPLIGQMQVEIHVRFEGQVPFPQHLFYWLWRHGFILFHSEPNWGLPICAEFSFIHCTLIDGTLGPCAKPHGFEQTREEIAYEKRMAKEYTGMAGMAYPEADKNAKSNVIRSCNARSYDHFQLTRLRKKHHHHGVQKLFRKRKLPEDSKVMALMPLYLERTTHICPDLAYVDGVPICRQEGMGPGLVIYADAKDFLAFKKAAGQYVTCTGIGENLKIQDCKGVEAKAVFRKKWGVVRIIGGTFAQAWKVVRKFRSPPSQVLLERKPAKKMFTGERGTEFYKINTAAMGYGTYFVDAIGNPGERRIGLGYLHSSFASSFDPMMEPGGPECSAPSIRANRDYLMDRGHNPNC